MERPAVWIDNLFSRKRVLLHILFWLVVLLAYVIFFGRRNSNYLQTTFFVSLLMPVTIGTTYFLNYVLIPNYLLREYYGRFLLYFIYTLVASLFLESVIAMLTFVTMAKVNIRAMSPASIDIFFLLAALLMVVFLGVAIKMLLHWRQSKEEYQKLMREKVETELRFLKTQMNPHFLFNTLNNLYYLAQEKSERTPHAILALSEILDYVMHSGRQSTVPLTQEWQQVNNYLKLELLRYEDRVLIHSSVVGDLEKHFIGPMMLMTLVENAFKHGVMNKTGQSTMDIRLEASETKMEFVIKNAKAGISPGQSGIGLSNLKSQLFHLYPNRHALSVEDEHGYFTVHLMLWK